MLHWQHFSQTSMAPEAVSNSEIVRFGTYEVDLRSGELRKNGLRVRLTGQPFQILVVLLENPGELVTREQLQKRLWPADTFVDFDRGLNSAINRLREALADSAENPRFVETLARRGYRFIGQVEAVHQSATSAAHLPAPPAPKFDGAFRNWRTATATGLLVVLIALSLAFITRRLLVQRSDQRLELIPLTSLPGQEISPSFSPDGEQVAFGWDGENNGAGFDLYVKVIGTEKPLRLTNHPAGWLGTAWSPDGRYIAVHRFSSGDDGIYLIPALGGPERKLTSTNTFPPAAAISWSPDGKQIAFIDHSPAKENPTNLFVLSLDTLERRLLETDCVDNIEPAFSPGGESLAYRCIQDAGHFSVNVRELRTGRDTQLFTSLQSIHGTAWDNDGRRVLFSQSSSPLGGGDLWQVDVAKNHEIQKLPVGHDATSPTISSRGDRLAYVQSQISANIWRLDLRGAKAHASVLVPSTLEQYDPVISPDGKRLVFISNRSGTGEIWVCDSDGGNPQQLTRSGGALTGTPRWSPDGRQIVFDSRIGDEANVYIVDANGGVPRKLETGTRMNSLPSWSHDGSSIYFASGVGAHLTIWRVAAKGGQATQLTKTRSLMPVESPDGRYVYFVRAADNQIRLWRVHPDGSGEAIVDAVPPLRSTGYEWSLAPAGIYFYKTVGGKTEIDFLDLRTSSTRRIYQLDKPPTPWLGGLSVSPDGKWLVYSRIDQVSRDLMLVDNFH